MMTSELFLRQLDAFNPEEQNKSVCIIGCGAIGSWTSLVLSKLGINDITLYDGDKIELHNISNQFFRRKDLGHYKSTITTRMCKIFNPDRDSLIITNRRKYFTKRDSLTSEIVIVCTDNIESRQLVFSKFMDSYYSNLLIDARMNIELMNIYSLTKDIPSLLEHYTKYHLDIDNVEEPCTRRTVIYNVQVIAGFIGDLVKKYCIGDTLPYQLVCHLGSLDFIKIRGI